MSYRCGPPPPFDSQAFQADRQDGTPGGWAWEVNRASGVVELCGGKGATDLTVMGFRLWRPGKAVPVFYDWEKGKTYPAAAKATAFDLAEPERGREHHASWLQRIDHPDARRIASVPTLEAEIARLRGALQDIVTFAPDEGTSRMASNVLRGL